MVTLSDHGPPHYFNSICRACRSTTDDMRQIFNSDVNFIPVSQMLSFATAISVRPDDNLPNSLCSFCLKRLIDAYKFLQMCIDSDAELRDILKKSSQYKIHSSLYTKPSSSTTSVEDETRRVLQSPPQTQIKTQSIKTSIENTEIKRNEKANDEEILPDNNRNSHIDVIEYDGTVIKFENHDYDDLDYLEYENKTPRKQSSVIISNQVQTEKKGNRENGFISSTIIAPNFKCNCCNKEFICYDDLDKHQTHAHVDLPDIISVDIDENTNDNITNEDLPKTTIKETITPPTSGPQEIGKFSCAFCKNTFHSWENLAKHIGEHKIRNIFGPIDSTGDKSTFPQCKICKKRFENVLKLNSHMAEKHKLYDETNFFDYDLAEELETGHEKGILLETIREVPVNLDMESTPRSPESANDDNENIEDNDSSFKFQCQFCPNNYTTRKSLRVHVVGKHKKNISSLEKYQCTYCSCLFVRYLDMIRHRKTHKTHVKPKKMDENKGCKSNETESDTMSKSKSTTNDIDNSSNTKYTCKKCGKTFGKYFSMIMHMKNIHSSKNRASFKCPYCPAFIKYRHNLPRHIKNIHKKIRNKKGRNKSNGNIDGANFESIEVTPDLPMVVEDTISDPLEITKTNKSLIPVQCTICSLVLANIYSYERHVRSLHCNNPSSDTEIIKPIKNNEITITRPIRSLAKVNELSPKAIQKTPSELAAAGLEFEVPKTAVNSWDCSECSRSFGTTWALRRHNIINHSSVKHMNSFGLYECNICEKKFIKKYSHISHLRIHKTNSNAKVSNEKLIASTTPTEKSPTHDRNRNSLCIIVDGERLRCLVCKKIFKNKKSFRVHYRSNHSDKIDTDVQSEYKCRLCYKYLKNKKQLRLHFERHRVFTDPTDDNQNNSSESKATKETTTRNVCKSLTTKLICRYCKKVSRTQLEHQAHLSRHNKPNKTQECHICGKRIAQVWNFRSHMEGHERRTQKAQAQKQLESNRNNESDVLKNTSLNVETANQNNIDVDMDLHNILANAEI